MPFRIARSNFVRTAWFSATLILCASCKNDPTAPVDKTGAVLFAVDSTAMKSRAVVGLRYCDTIPLTSPGIQLSFLDSAPGMSLSGNVISWIPDFGNTGPVSIAIQAMDALHQNDSLSWTINLEDTAALSEIILMIYQLPAAGNIWAGCTFSDFSMEVTAESGERWRVPGVAAFAVSQVESSLHPITFPALIHTRELQLASYHPAAFHPDEKIAAIKLKYTACGNYMVFVSNHLKTVAGEVVSADVASATGQKIDLSAYTIEKAIVHSSLAEVDSTSFDFSYMMRVMDLWDTTSIANYRTHEYNFDINDCVQQANALHSHYEIGDL